LWVALGTGAAYFFWLRPKLEAERAAQYAAQQPGRPAPSLWDTASGLLAGWYAKKERESAGKKTASELLTGGKKPSSQNGLRKYF